MAQKIQAFIQGFTELVQLNNGLSVIQRKQKNNQVLNQFLWIL